jgi:predicted  nucleic acid-binding Zn-ribbon protein
VESLKKSNDVFVNDSICGSGNDFIYHKTLENVSLLIKEDKKDLELQVSKLEDIKEELAQKESQIEAAKDEVLRIDEEIKAWESQHWKMKRNPPSSAILD